MPTKRHDPRRIKRHRSYTVGELATVQKVHKNTVRAWMRAGLAPIDARRPLLFPGEAVRTFLERQQTDRKRPCPPGLFYCFGCRDRRPPALGMVDFVERPAGGAGNLTALCDHCGTVMNRRASRAALDRSMPGCAVTIRRAEATLTGTTPPPANCHLER